MRMSASGIATDNADLHNPRIVTPRDSHPDPPLVHDFEKGQAIILIASK